MACLLAVDGNGNLRLLSRREADKGRVGGGILLAGFRGAGLTCHVYRVIGESSLGSTAGTGDLLHAFQHSAVSLVGNHHIADDGGLIFLHQGPVIVGHHPLQEGGLKPLAPVGNGGHIDTQLQGGKAVVGLANGCQNLVAFVPVGILAGVQGLLGLLVGPVAGFLVKLHTGALAQAKALGCFIDVLNGHHIAQNVEIIVTGFLQRLHGIDHLVGAAAVGPCQALGAPVAVILAVNTFVPDLIGGADIAVVDTRHHHGHLVGGSGGIGGKQRPVEHGQQRILFQGVVLLAESIQIIGRIAGTGQDLTGIGVHGHHGAAFSILAVHILVLLVAQGFQGPGQFILGNALQLQINGSFHIVSGLGQGKPAGGDDVALFVDGVLPETVHTVELLFKNLLQAGLAHHGIHLVAFDILIVFPLLFIHGTGMTQNVGGIFGGILPDGGSFHHQTGGIQFQDGGQVIALNVLDEDIIVQVCHAAQGKFIVNADDRPGILIGPVLGDLVAGAEPLQQQRGSDIGVDFLICQVFLEITLPGRGLLLQGILKGPVLGDGEVVHIFGTDLIAQLVKLQKIVVGTLGAVDNIGDQHQVITGPVADQRIAVAVQDIAPGSLDGGAELEIVGIRLVLGFHDLHIIELKREEAHHHQKREQQHRRPEAGYSFHVSPPILLTALRTGYIRGMVKPVSSTVIRKLPSLSGLVSPSKSPIINTAISYPSSASPVQNRVEPQPLRRYICRKTDRKMPKAVSSTAL